MHVVADVLQRYPQNPATLEVGQDLRRLLLLDYTAPQRALELMYSNPKFNKLSQQSTIVIPSFPRALQPFGDDEMSSDGSADEMSSDGSADEMSSLDYAADDAQGEQTDRVRGSS